MDGWRVKGETSKKKKKRKECEVSWISTSGSDLKVKEQLVKEKKALLIPSVLSRFYYFLTLKRQHVVFYLMNTSHGF